MGRVALVSRVVAIPARPVARRSAETLAAESITG